SDRPLQINNRLQCDGLVRALFDCSQRMARGARISWQTKTRTVRSGPPGANLRIAFLEYYISCKKAMSRAQNIVRCVAKFQYGRPLLQFVRQRSCPMMDYSGPISANRDDGNYCRAESTENSPLLMRSDRPCAKRAVASSP